MTATVMRRSLGLAITLLACTGLTAFGDGTRVQGFESGDPAVTSIGDAGEQGTFENQAAPDPTTQFLLTTIGNNAAGEDNLSPLNGAGPAVSNASLASFFGNTLFMDGNEGSGVLIPFTVIAGQTQLTFEADFLSNEPFQDPDVRRNDFSFFGVFDASNAIQVALTKFATVNGSTFLNDSNFTNPFQFHSGYQTYTVSLDGLAPGDYTLGIGVQDANTANHASGLLLDNVQLVPEPSVFALAIAGAGLLVGVRRRIRRS
jgi:hypothetical protein